MLAARDGFAVLGGRLDCDRLNDSFIRQIRDEPTHEGLVSVYWHLPYAVSANMALTREVFDELGGFDENFAVGADEMDFCWRAQYEGFSVGFAPEAIVAYRFKTQLPGLVRQLYSYGQGCARLRAKHIRLGRVPKQSVMQQLSLLKKYVMALSPRVGLIHRTERWKYAQDAAWCAGSIAGLFKYRAIF
jgi:GT2 family glycosyltransferase